MERFPGGFIKKRLKQGLEMGKIYSGISGNQHISDPEIFVDNQARKRSGHMSHAMLEYAPGKIIAFNSNCSALRYSGHSAFGWIEYRYSGDYGRTIPLPQKADLLHACCGAVAYQLKSTKDAKLFPVIAENDGQRRIYRHKSSRNFSCNGKRFLSKIISGRIRNIAGTFTENM